jgi:hypothetical protein
MRTVKCRTGEIVETYNHYRHTEHWAAVRNKFLGTRNGVCEKCGSKKDLSVHHIHYETLGCETGEELKLLCWKCHMKKHTGCVGQDHGMITFDQWRRKNRHLVGTTVPISSGIKRDA